MLGNRRFQDMLLESLPGDIGIGRLRKIVETGFLNVEGHIIFRAFEENFERLDLSSMYDATAVEAFVNHIHLEDYLETAASSNAVFISLTLAREVKKKLKMSFPNIRFRFILGLDGDDDMTFSFHSIRQGQSYLSDDIEGFTESLLVLNF